MTGTLSISPIGGCARQVERGADLFEGRRLIYQAGVAYSEGRR